jgi:hypothetical protein
MTIRLPFVNWIGYALVGALVLFAAQGAYAQTTPRIETLFPAGAQRGTQTKVQLIGEFMPGVCQLNVAGDGLNVTGPLMNGRFTVTAGPDAPPGLREIRLSSVQGASAPFPFLIGELPELTHVEHGQPRELQLPVTVNGQLKSAGDLHEYLVTLSANEQLVCAVSAREFASPVDAVVRLLDADQKLVATSDSYRSADALLVYRAPTPGRYTLQLFDFQMAGGPQHIYRATVTTGPWLDYTFPAGVPQNTASSLTLYGWNLPSPNLTSLEHRVSAGTASSLDISLPGGANRLTIPVGDQPEQSEVEPNNTLERAQDMSLPKTVNGRLGAPGDVDVFAFIATKGDRLAIDLDSAELQFPTDLVLSIINEAGKSLLEADDNKTSRDPSARFTVPADGRYFVSIRDRSRDGGDDFVYRLRLGALRPDVTARANVHSLALHSGQTTNLAVIVDRIDALADELELTAEGLPDGVEVKPQAVPAKTPATIQLPFTVADKRAPISKLIRIIVRGTDKSKPLERAALIAESAQAKTGSSGLWVAVSPEIPFALKTTTVILDAPRMAAFPFPVTAERKEGFTGAIRLIGVEPDRRGTVAPLTGQIAADSDTGTIPLVIQHKVTEGTTHRCRVMGVADVLGTDGKTYPVFQVASGSMSIGCAPSLLTMKSEPAVVVWSPSTTASITVHVNRYVPMQPITLRLKLPSEAQGLLCEPIELTAEQNHGTLTLRFSDSVSLPPRTTVSIMAESSRDGLPIFGTTSFRLETP